MTASTQAKDERTPLEFYEQVLLRKLTRDEIYELFRLLDDGLDSDLCQVLGDASSSWFPEDFIPAKTG